jgi:hypothetical protein
LETLAGRPALTGSPFTPLVAPLKRRPRDREGEGAQPQPLPRDLDSAHLAAIADMTRIVLLWQKTRVPEVEFSFLRYSKSKGKMGGGRFWPTLRDAQGNAWPKRYPISHLGRIQGAYYRALEFQRASGEGRNPASLYMAAVDAESGPTFPWLFVDDVKREQFESEALGEDFQIVLETSSGNFQSWLLDDAIPASKYERSVSQGELAAFLGADKNAGGFSRLARAPGSINWKAGKNSFATKLIRCSELAADLAKALPCAAQGEGEVDEIRTLRNLPKSDWISVVEQFEASRTWRHDWKEVEYAAAEIARGQRGDCSEDDWRECHRLIFSRGLRPLFVMEALMLASVRRQKHSPDEYAARTIANLVHRRRRQE